MGWFGGTPKWYDKIIRMQNVPTELVETYLLEKNSIDRLEDLRKSYGLDDDNFVFLYMGCKTVVKKGNLLISRKFKKDSNPGTPESEIAKRLLMLDLESFRENISLDDFILLEKDYKNVIKNVNTIDEAITQICHFSEKKDAPPVTYMRKIIDAILGWE
jgi:hypothetical protein